jgi:hypothetical protein
LRSKGSLDFSKTEKIKFNETLIQIVERKIGLKGVLKSSNNDLLQFTLFPVSNSISANFRSISKYCNNIQVKQEQVLNYSNVHIRLLEYICIQNNFGLRPTFSEISKYLRLSRPTVRNKISFLKNEKLILINQIGREKNISLSRKGKRVIGLRS